MDYTDKFFQNLKPANEQQQHFIYYAEIGRTFVFLLIWPCSEQGPRK